MKDELQMPPALRAKVTGVAEDLAAEADRLIAIAATAVSEGDKITEVQAKILAASLMVASMSLASVGSAIPPPAETIALVTVERPRRLN
jgi:hypothetical protein